MSSPEEDWWSVRTGEYVLGTLRGKDLELFKRILAHDTTVQAEVAHWERRLAALDETTHQQAPGEHVWPQLLERIRRPSTSDSAPAGALEETQVDTDSRVAPAIDNLTNTHEVKPVQRSLVWPLVAGLATAACAVLGLLLLLRVAGPAPMPINVDGLAVVLSDESGAPYFLVETDYQTMRVRVTALSPPSLDEGRDFQLWQALPDRSSVRPVALLPKKPGNSRVFKVESLISKSDLFGVSIEPAGAATDAGPTGPVVAHGDFVVKHDSN